MMAVANAITKRTGAVAEDELSFPGRRFGSARAKGKHAMTDEDRTRWRRHFALLLLPHAPVLSSLMEAADKLVAAKGFLDGLSSEVEAEREQGLFVAALAIDYGLKMLEHFGLVDGPNPPMPASLSQAQQAVGNLLSYVCENIRLEQMVRSDADDDDTLGDDAASEKPKDDKQASEDALTFTVDKDTFTVSYRGKRLFLGNVREFWLLERLNRCPGNYLNTITLMEDVWNDIDAEKSTVQKTVSNLRKKLKKAGFEGVVIDGEQADHYALKLS